VRAGDLVWNTFSYHMTPGAWILDTGARALGAAVFPAGVGNTEQQVAAAAAVRPNVYCGVPDFLKILLDKAAETGADLSSITSALVSGAALPASLRRELGERGVKVLQAYATADLGVVAYESEATEGLIVNEDVIVEIVRPGTGEPVAEGEVGEVVVTRFHDVYPLFRFATGDLSAVLPGESPCGRTNMRIKGWMGRADQRTKVKGMFVDPAQVDRVLKRFPAIGRGRLVVTRAGEQDAMTLRIEAAGDESLPGKVAEAFKAETGLSGSVETVEPGTLPNDGKVIADERPVDG
jgi:phenylacetate-CoA ligase